MARAAAGTARKRVREPRRQIAYVRPQWLDHEAQAVLDLIRASVGGAAPLNGIASPFLMTAADELARVLEQAPR